MEIINDGYPDDEKILLESIKCTYYQEPDCVSNEDGYQELTLETRDGGGGKFINLKTAEDGWSFSDIDELLIVINDFLSKFKNENSNNSGCTRPRFLEESDKE